MNALDAGALRVLMAGESWMTHSLHVKGFDSFTTSTYMEGGSALLIALRSCGVDVTYQPCQYVALSADITNANDYSNTQNMSYNVFSPGVSVTGTDRF